MGSENLRLASRRSEQDESKCQTFVILPHIIAEAMSSLHGLDLRWSGPITPTEMRYVEQYVQARYPEYYCLLGSIDKENLPVGFTIVKEDGETIDYGNCSSSGSQTEDSQQHSLRFSAANRDFSACFGKSLSDLNRTQLEEMSRLVELLTKRVSSSDHSLSVPEMHARNKVLNHCGVSEDDYIVVFSTGTKEALHLVGESYPFQRYTYYMTVLEEEIDCIRKFATYKEAKVIATPASWLDLRIAGSQLSQHFRKKSKHIPKGLFGYAADIGGSRNSLHWVSEAQRNHWHVLLDCAELVLGVDQLNLTLHKPDFVLCTIPKKVNHPTKITCLLVRRNSFILSN